MTIRRKANNNNCPIRIASKLKTYRYDYSETELSNVSWNNDGNGKELNTEEYYVSETRSSKPKIWRPKWLNNKLQYEEESRTL